MSDQRSHFPQPPSTAQGPTASTRGSSGHPVVGTSTGGARSSSTLSLAQATSVPGSGPSARTLLRMKAMAAERGVSVDELVDEMVNALEVQQSEGGVTANFSSSVHSSPDRGGFGPGSSTSSSPQGYIGSRESDNSLMKRVPIDSIVAVFEYLPISTLSKLLRIVCRSWKNIVETHPRIRYLLSIGGFGVMGAQFLLNTSAASLPMKSVPPLFCAWQRKWIDLPEVSIPRYHASVSVWDRKVFICGGREDQRRSERVEMLDLSTGGSRSSTWIALPPLSRPRSAPYSAVLGGKLYVMGGYDGDSELATGEWIDLRDVMQAVEHDERSWLEANTIVGSNLSSSGYDYASSPYSRLLSSPTSAGAGGLFPRTDTGASSVQQFSPGQLLSPSLTYSSVSSLKWKVMEQSMPYASCEGACVQLNPYTFCIAGGCANRDMDDEHTLDFVQVFDSHLGRWLVGPPMQSKRYGLGLAYDEKRRVLIAAGGSVDDVPSKSIETLQVIPYEQCSQVRHPLRSASPPRGAGNTTTTTTTSGGSNSLDPHAPLFVRDAPPTTTLDQSSLQLLAEQEEEEEDIQVGSIGALKPHWRRSQEYLSYLRSNASLAHYDGLNLCCGGVLSDGQTQRSRQSIELLQTARAATSSVWRWRSVDIRRWYCSSI